jgi:hypothetical protein
MAMMENEEKVIEHNEFDYLSVRQLIALLLQAEDIDMEICFQDKEGKRLHGVSIVAKKVQRNKIGVLFG